MSDRNEYKANERTYLAWIRTSIAMIGFGFVIVKFSLFLEQVSHLLDRELDVPETIYSANSSLSSGSLL